MSTTLQNFYKATITKNWTATTGDFNVSVKPTTSSGWLVISANNTTLREIVYFNGTGTNAYGDYVTIVNIADRGLGGTTAQTHTIGETIRMNVTAEHWAEMQADIAAIIAGSFITPGTSGNTLVSNGTNWVSTRPTTKNGITTRAYDAASGVQTIAHGLGRIPTNVEIVAVVAPGGDSVATSIGFYDGTNNSSVTNSGPGGGSGGVASSSTYGVNMDAIGDGSVTQNAVITVDSTNITLTWTKVGSPASVTMNILWKVF